MSLYARDFTKAFQLYTQCNKRPGYIPGILTWFRHSNTLYHHISELQNNLKKADSKEAGRQILLEYFRSSKTTFNNHSFSLYLLDILNSTYPNENWDSYYPQEKKIKFFTGTLYRGTLQPPESAFVKGMSSATSEKIEDYANDLNLNIGISTSKSKDVADSYKITTILTNRGAFYKQGYVYKIDYREKGGVDIIKTLRARKSNVTAAIASHKDEVNIIGNISSEDIVGCWDCQGVFYKNPRYLPNKKTEKPRSFIERLRELFTPKREEQNSTPSQPSTLPTSPISSPSTSTPHRY